MQKEEQKAKTERRCIVTGKVRPKSDLIRFVAGPENTLIPDIKGKLPGRGVWVTPEKEKIAEAVKRKLFERNLAKDIAIAPEIDHQVEILLKEAALGCLKMANKAGNAIFGFTKLMAALEKQAIICLIHAEQASPAESNKLDHKFRTNLEQSEKLQQISRKKPFWGFQTSELSLAFGAANVIHAGLTESGATLAAMNAVARLAHYQGSSDPDE